MKLTPLDLQQKSFKAVRFGGIDEREVRQYLDFVANELEDMTRKMHRQDEELRRREARINEFKDREQLLQQTLTTAQRLADEMRANVRKEAEIVMSDAELQAEKIIANAQAKRMQLITEIDELKRARASFLQQHSSLVEMHKTILEGIRGEQASPEAPVQGDNVSFFAAPAPKREGKK
jgi:cell division initiation protein